MNLHATIMEWSYLWRARFRRRRYDYFWRSIGQSVGPGWWLDLGGGPGSYFLTQFPERRRLILLEINQGELRQALGQYPEARGVVADGQHLPFKNQSVACIFCNSVIEHVPDPAQLAREVQRVGRNYFVQTPNGNFPLETHSAIPVPFYRWMPRAWRAKICRALKTPWEYVESVTYVSEANLRRYFPATRIERERVWGLTKSFYVLSVRPPREPSSPDSPTAKKQ